MTDCPTCGYAVDAEGFCSFCANVTPLHQLEPHSVRVRTHADPAEVRRLVETYGVQRAAQVVEQSLIDELLGSRR